MVPAPVSQALFSVEHPPPDVTPAGVLARVGWETAVRRWWQHQDPLHAGVCGCGLPEPYPVRCDLTEFLTGEQDSARQVEQERGRWGT